MSNAGLPRRNGCVHPSVNAEGTDSIGYICDHDAVLGYQFCIGFMESGKVTQRHLRYSDALKELRQREREAWGTK